MFLIIPGDGMKPLDPLASALRALPMHEPPPDLFAEISGSLQERRTRRRWFMPTALAASVLIALLLMLPRSGVTPTANVHTELPTGTTDPVSPAGEIDRLRADSRILEAWLGGLPGEAPRDGRSLMATAEIEDLVGLIDVQLSAARNDTESLPLWRQRVALLEDLASIRSEPLASMADAGLPETSSNNAF